MDTKILDFGKLFRTTLFSVAKKSYNKLKIPEFGNYGNIENCMKIYFDANKEGSNKDIGFWKTI